MQMGTGRLWPEYSSHPFRNTLPKGRCQTLDLTEPLRKQIRQDLQLRVLPIHRVVLTTISRRFPECLEACHPIQPSGLGAPETYNRNYHVAAVNDPGRPLYGPYPVDAAKIAPLHLSGSGYPLAESQHLREAALCGICHTLFTNSIAADGREAGTLPEQMVYLEWLHCDYHDK